jgi:hypothetical protein
MTGRRAAHSQRRLRRPVEGLCGGDDVEQGELLDLLRVIESEAVGDAPTAIMSGDGEAGKYLVRVTGIMSSASARFA